LLITRRSGARDPRANLLRGIFLAFPQRQSRRLLGSASSGLECRSKIVSHPIPQSTNSACGEFLVSSSSIAARFHRGILTNCSGEDSPPVLDFPIIALPPAVPARAGKDELILLCVDVIRNYIKVVCVRGGACRVLQTSAVFGRIRPGPPTPERAGGRVCESKLGMVVMSEITSCIAFHEKRKQYRPSNASRTQIANCCLFRLGSHSQDCRLKVSDRKLPISLTKRNQANAGPLTRLAR